MKPTWTTADGQTFESQRLAVEHEQRTALFALTDGRVFEVELVEFLVEYAAEVVDILGGVHRRPNLRTGSRADQAYRLLVLRPYPVKELAQTMGCDSRQLSSLLCRMRGKGYVQKNSDSHWEVTTP
jgi:hypothetical protein